MPASSITCVFHSSPSVVGLLHVTAGQLPGGDLFVECAPAPSLGFVLGLETPSSYPGIAGLLGGASLGSLGYASDRLPAPVVLAPGTGTAPHTIRAALALLARTDECPPHVTLLVPTGGAASLGASLTLADRYLLAWDISEYPHDELIEFARWLRREHLVDRESFQGVLAYASQPLDAQHGERLAALLAPLATAECPAGVLPLAE